MYDIPTIVTFLKLVMVVVMFVGGVAVFRELIPMARGRLPAKHTVTPPSAEDA